MFCRRCRTPTDRIPVSRAGSSLPSSAPALGRGAPQPCDARSEPAGEGFRQTWLRVYYAARASSRSPVTLLPLFTSSWATSACNPHTYGPVESGHPRDEPQSRAHFLVYVFCSLPARNELEIEIPTGRRRSRFPGPLVSPTRYLGFLRLAVSAIRAVSTTRWTATSVLTGGSLRPPKGTLREDGSGYLPVRAARRGRTGRRRGIARRRADP